MTRPAKTNQVGTNYTYSWNTKYFNFYKEYLSFDVAY